MVAMSYSFVTIVSIFLIVGAVCGIIYWVGTLRLHITEDIMYERTIDGHMLREMLAGGLANLKANADEINDLNVFPIPDGDTGDNMVSTLSGGHWPHNRRHHGPGHACRILPRQRGDFLQLQGVR